MEELLHEPVNEGGVMFAFGAVARRLGLPCGKYEGVSRLRSGAGGGARTLAACVD